MVHQLTRAARLAVLVGLVFGITGCLRHRLAMEIVRAPNRRKEGGKDRIPGHSPLQTKADQTYAAAWQVPVGPPAANITVAIVNPGDYQLKHSVGAIKVGEDRYRLGPITDWTLPAKALAGSNAPLATVFLLPGYYDSKENLLFWALFLAQHRYRSVLVDLRGEGRSTGEWITYGAVERHDLKQVLDDTLRRGWIAGPVAALGISYGASMALDWAGQDERVKSIVAIEPFSDPRRAVIDFAHAVRPDVARLFSDAAFHAAEDRSAQIAQFSWADASVLDSVARIQAPIIYLCADHDHWVPPENSRRLADQSRDCRGVMTAHFTGTGDVDDHVVLSWVLEPGIGQAVVTFLGSTVGGGTRQSWTKFQETKPNGPVGG